MQRQGLRLPGRLLLFGLLFGLLRLVYDTLGDGAVPTWVIQGFTVPTAAAVLGALDPQLGVMAIGARLQASGGGLQVLAGCEGSDAALLLASAMLVVPGKLAAARDRHVGRSAGHGTGQSGPGAGTVLCLAA